MPNLNGGKSYRKKKSHSESINRQLIFKEDGQEYGYINSLLGNKHCQVKLKTGNVVLGIIRGNMKKSTSRINKDDVVLVSLRDYQESKVDIIHVYNLNETKNLIAYEEIDEEFVNQQREVLNSENIVFENIDDI